MDTSFKNKKRYTLLQIIIRIIVINVFSFSNLIVNRIIFGDIGLDGDIEGRLGFYFFFYFLLVLVFFVLSGFEIRLINNDRARVLNVEAKIDYFYKIICFGITLLIASLSDSNKTIQLIFLSTAFIILIIFDIFIYLFYRGKVNSIVIDWLDLHRDKSKKEKQDDAKTAGQLNNKSILVFSATVFSLIPTIILSNNLLIKSNELLSVILFSIFAVVYLISTVLELEHFKRMNVLNIMSLIFTVGILFVCYFIHNNFGDWSLFLLGFVLVNLPLLNTNRQIARKLFSK